MSATTLISVIYKSERLARAVAQLDNITKLVLIAAPEGQQTEIDTSIQDVQEFFDDALEIDVRRAEPYDIVATAREFNDAIKQEAPRDVVINVTHGRKTQAFAGTFAAFANHDNVRDIVYLPEEGGKISLPRLEITLNEKEHRVLQAVDEGQDVDGIQNELDVSKGMVYNYLRDLKEQGYIEETDEGNQLTDSGQLMLVLK